MALWVGRGLSYRHSEEAQMLYASFQMQLIHIISLLLHSNKVRLSDFDPDISMVQLCNQIQLSQLPQILFNNSWHSPRNKLLISLYRLL